MRIWIIDHYSVPERYYPLIRQTIFARKFTEMGHQIRIFSASSVHNSQINLIENGEKYKEENTDGVCYTYVNCRSYQGNGIGRIRNMLEFPRKLPAVCEKFAQKEGKPDAVIACSMTLQACKCGIKIARRYGAKVVAQITDLWPESIVCYTNIGKNNLIIKYLRCVEKWIYVKADKLVFTMEGAYDYIQEQHWQNQISREKVEYINNGVDVEAFLNNKKAYKISDEDLDNNDVFKVVYTGSVRKVNDLGILLDAAKYIDDTAIKILIWGDGDEVSKLKERIEKEHIDNVKFKGKVDKKYIPYITSSADLNIAHNTPSALFRFGISFNKIFDYFAAGKPILADFPCPYNPVIIERAGVGVDDPTPQNIAKEIIKLKNLAKEEYRSYCEKSFAAAQKYDFNNLTNKMLEVIEGIR